MVIQEKKPIKRKKDYDDDIDEQLAYKYKDKRSPMKKVK